jgi:hypothetical protein
VKLATDETVEDRRRDAVLVSVAEPDRSYVGQPRGLVEGPECAVGDVDVELDVRVAIAFVGGERPVHQESRDAVVAVGQIDDAVDQPALEKHG